MGWIKKCSRKSIRILILWKTSKSGWTIFAKMKNLLMNVLILILKDPAIFYSSLKSKCKKSHNSLSPNHKKPNPRSKRLIQTKWKKKTPNKIWNKTMFMKLMRDNFLLVRNKWGSESLSLSSCQLSWQKKDGNFIKSIAYRFTISLKNLKAHTKGFYANKG